MVDFMIKVTGVKVIKYFFLIFFLGKVKYLRNQSSRTKNIWLVKTKSC